MADSKHADKLEMRRRWRAVLEDGTLARLGSEGRLVASYVQHWADFSTCEIRFSMRYVAKYLQAQVTTVRRGVSQLVEAGILVVTNPGSGGRRTTYLVVDRTAASESDPDTLRARERAPDVRATDTLRARAGHATCAPRAPVVRGARTLCARNTFLSLGSPKRTKGESIEAPPGTGQGPAPAHQEAAEEVGPSEVAGQLDAFPKLMDEETA